MEKLDRYLSWCSWMWRFFKKSLKMNTLYRQCHVHSLKCAGAWQRSVFHFRRRYIKNCRTFKSVWSTKRERKGMEYKSHCHMWANRNFTLGLECICSKNKTQIITSGENRFRNHERWQREREMKVNRWGRGGVIEQERRKKQREWVSRSGWE